MHTPRAFILQEKPACRGRSSIQNGDGDQGQRHGGSFKGDLGNSKYLCSNWAVWEQLHPAHVDWRGLVAVSSVVGFSILYGQ